MKKLSVFLLFTVLSVLSLSAKDRLFTTSLGITSGYPFYGSREISDLNYSLYDKGNKVIIGGLGVINLNLIDQFSFFTDAEILADFNWVDRDFYNHLDYDFSLGFKIYPGLGGINTGMAYCLGSRVDFKKIEDRRKTINQPWGNGFKLFLEYNFAHNSKWIHLPVIGISWRFMPRGYEIFDNIITAYLLINF